MFKVKLQGVQKQHRYHHLDFKVDKTLVKRIRDNIDNQTTNPFERMKRTVIIVC